MDTMTSFYPVVMTDDVAASAAFYVEHLGFETTFEADWYVSLRHGAFELAVLRHDHETVPTDFRRTASGILLNYEVDDARAAFDRLVTRAGLEVARDLRDEAFGQRHFIVVAPGGVLVDVIENIAPAAEYADAYAEA
jgi:catechol 2,3-dioxygenase-like lactoylglutathione lyase family enzyme